MKYTKVKNLVTPSLLSLAWCCGGILIIVILVVVVVLVVHILEGFIVGTSVKPACCPIAVLMVVVVNVVVVNVVVVNVVVGQGHRCCCGRCGTGCRTLRLRGCQEIGNF